MDEKGGGERVRRERTGGRSFESMTMLSTLHTFYSFSRCCSVFCDVRLCSTSFLFSPFPPFSPSPCCPRRCATQEVDADLETWLVDLPMDARTRAIQNGVAFDAGTTGYAGRDGTVEDTAYNIVWTRLPKNTRAVKSHLCDIPAFRCSVLPFFPTLSLLLSFSVTRSRLSRTALSPCLTYLTCCWIICYTCTRLAVLRCLLSILHQCTHGQQRFCRIIYSLSVPSTFALHSAAPAFPITFAAADPGPFYPSLSIITLSSIISK